MKKNNFNNDINGSLLGVINYTKIPMGLRLLNKWIEQPLIDIDRIVKRQNLIEELINNISVKNELNLILMIYPILKG